MSYSVVQGMFFVTDALKRVAKVVEGRGGEGRGSPDPVSRTNWKIHVYCSLNNISRVMNLKGSTSNLTYLSVGKIYASRIKPLPTSLRSAFYSVGKFTLDRPRSLMSVTGVSQRVSRRWISLHNRISKTILFFTSDVTTPMKAKLANKVQLFAFGWYSFTPSVYVDEVIISD